MTSPTPPFLPRHLGIHASADTAHMLNTLGYASTEALADAALPSDIRQPHPLRLHDPLSEPEVQERLRSLASLNQPMTQLIGQGYYETVTPATIRRNILENPAWYTSYTPYQPEISQGRLEALLNFQTVVSDLTALPIANASLLDEATAVVEAVLLMRRANKANDRGLIVLDADLFPQTFAVIRARAEALKLELLVADLSSGILPSGKICGVVLQQPGASGAVHDHAPLITAAHDRGAMVTVVADLLALTLITPPGEQGADVAVGTTQRFGVPLFFGGPHAAYMAVRSGLERTLPGRLVGASQDSAGRTGYRLALQTREQHIRREKATSNICTAQALLAIVAGMYAVYHGPQGLRSIAQEIHTRTARLAAALREAGHVIRNRTFFDTLTISVPHRASFFCAEAEQRRINLRYVDDDTLSIALGETASDTVLNNLLAIFHASFGASSAPSGLPAHLRRTSPYLEHPVFHSYHSETQLMRYMRRLSDQDLALDRTMIPLGSCTMKLNAAVEMEAISWPEFASIHPFAPEAQTVGWRKLIAELENDLASITGYDKVSLQPNAGSQGELAGLLAIRSYHASRGEAQRDVCLIPASAHGTNAASAVLAGMRVLVIATAEDGSVDYEDLLQKIAEHGDTIAAIMLTYPSTHGVYDANIRSICDAIHAAGAQVYIDGANLNALVGLAQPGVFGGDVSHLNLHKTFCIPHGGGGPGVGPVAVKAHLAPFLPTDANRSQAPGTPVAASMFGSAGVLPISWAYIKLMGAEGLTAATRAAILAANYIAQQLQEHFPLLYAGNHGLVAHECILDIRDITARTGVTAEDIAKRLIDYGFHAPTLAFPVAGTLMVEPTESEDLAELDRFIAAMIAIRREIDHIVEGQYALDTSPLRLSPHTAESVTASIWERPYSREMAAFPLRGTRHASGVKYFPPVGRIDGARGDRNLVCSCPPLEALADRVLLSASHKEQP